MQPFTIIISLLTQVPWVDVEFSVTTLVALVVLCGYRAPAGSQDTSRRYS